MIEDDEEDSPVPLAYVFERLPLLGDTYADLYLRMQFHNISIADNFLYNLEDRTFAEWNSSENDHLPLPKVMLLSSISQLWVFGLYELLRTWREYLKEVISYGDRLSIVTEKDPALREKRMLQQRERFKKSKSIGSIGWALSGEDESDHEYAHSGFFVVEEDASYLNSLRQIRDRIEPVFQIIELIRVALAKHEIHNAPGVKAQGVGYSRMDRESGSLMWFIYSKDGSQLLITRRKIADKIRELSQNNQKQ